MKNLKGYSMKLQHIYYIINKLRVEVLLISTFQGDHCSDAKICTEHSAIAVSKANLSTI